MMLLLILYVSLDRSFIRRAHRKRRVSILPMKIGVACAVMLHPFGATLLDLFDDLLQRMVLGQNEERMHMIVNAADDERRAVPFLEDPGLVSEEVFAHGRRKP